MASLKKRKRKDGTLASPFWWVKWRDPSTGRVCEKSTHFVIGNPEHLRQALRLKAGKQLLELSASGTTSDSRYLNWVPAFLKTHYTNPLTLQRMTTIWKTLSAYLGSISVFGPEQLTREQGQNYVAWREALGHAGAKKKKPVHRNTICLELKLLGFLQGEAVRRKFVEVNKARELDIKRGRTTHRPELTAAHARIVRAAIARRLAVTLRWISQPRPRPQRFEERRNAIYLHRSFEIATRQGIRLTETHIHLRNQVDMSGGYLTLKAKGNRDYQAPINPELKPLLQQWLDEGCEWTYELPPMHTLVWSHFMRGLRAQHPELGQATFHGTRVNVITRLANGGTEESITMKLVNHAGPTVHRIYRRLTQAQIAGEWKNLAQEPAPASSSVSSRAPKPAASRRDTSRTAPRRTAASARKSRADGK